MVFEKTLVTMVKGICAARGAEDEYIQAAMREIKEELHNANLRVKSMAVLKLAYLNMLGYDILWASLSIVDCMSRADKMSLRRPAYLAANFCFQEKNDLGLMLINHYKKELTSGHKTQTEIGIALTSLATICTLDMSRELITDLVALLASNKPYIRKKTVLCMFRLFLRYPLGLRTAFPKLKERLLDEDQGVLTACVNTFLELARKNGKNYLILVPHFFTLLTQTNNNWLMIKLLKVFSCLCPLEPRLIPKLEDPIRQILTTTRAKSIEFEAIRTIIRTFPITSPLTATAVEKLRPYLFSADRNLRYLGLETVDTYLKKHGNVNLYPDLHEKILECIEEVDPTIRTIALSVLDKIVSKQLFPKIAETLLSMSSADGVDSGSEAEYIKTLLQMGEADQYGLVEDFGWYLLTLAEIAKRKHAPHMQAVADQFLDVTCRVEGVRPYAVGVAQILLAGEEEKGVSEAAPPIAGCMAFILGEYQAHLDGTSHLTTIENLLSVPNSFPPSVICICVWASVKLLAGAAAVVESDEEYDKIRSLVLQKLPEFVLSPQVEVSERATMAYFAVEHHARRGDFGGLFQGMNELEILVPDEQETVQPPEGLDIDTPFYIIPEPEPPKPQTLPEHEIQIGGAAQIPTDPQLLAGLNANMTAETLKGANGNEGDALFLLKQRAGMVEDGSAVGADGKPVAPPTPVKIDPLAAMREKMKNQQQNYTVARKEIVKPAGGSPTLGQGQQGQQMNQAQLQAQAQAQAQAAQLQHRQQMQQPTAGVGPAVSSSVPANFLPVPSEKEMQDMMGKKWAVWAKDDNVAVYLCMKNKKGNLFRVDIRLEKTVKLASVKIGNIRLKLGDGSVLKFAGAGSGVGNVNEFPLVEGGFLDDRSGKIKVLLDVGGLESGAAGNGAVSPLSVPVELVYDEERERSKSSSSLGSDIISAKSDVLSAKTSDDLLDLLGDPVNPAPTTTEHQENPTAPNETQGGVTGTLAATTESVMVTTARNIVCELKLPASTSMTPKRLTEDAVASYIGEYSRQHLGAQAGTMCSFPLAEISQYEPSKLLDSGMTGIVSKVAACCNFHGIQQGGAVGNLMAYNRGER